MGGASTVDIWRGLSALVARRYVPGQMKSLRRTGRRTHLYERAASGAPALPMCRDGWTSQDGQSYDIWTGQIGPDGVCKRCLARAAKYRAGVPARMARKGSNLPAKRFRLEEGI